MLNSRFLTLLLFSVGFFSFGGNVLAQKRTYTKTQISSGAFNHESPSINNPGGRRLESAGRRFLAGLHSACWCNCPGCATWASPRSQQYESHD